MPISDYRTTIDTISRYNHPVICTLRYRAGTSATKRFSQSSLFASVLFIIASLPLQLSCNIDKVT